MVVSVATAMIPFLENDDNTRALMGSNMQKQAVPLLRQRGAHRRRRVWSTRPLYDCGVVVIAAQRRVPSRVGHGRRDCQLSPMTARTDLYKLIKFKRSNQGTCVNQRPIVRKGERVEKGDVIADGPCNLQRRDGAGQKCAHRLYDLGGL